MLYLSFLASHYSNGQPPGFFKDSVTLQHDYVGGDFSTNFLQLMLFRSKFIQKKYKEKPKRFLFTTALGLRWDFGTPGALAFSEEQEKSYGNYRIKGVFQLRLSPINIWNYNNVYTSSSGKNYSMKELIELRFRWEPEFIVGDMSNYYTNELGGNHRFSSHFYLEVLPLRSRNLGFMMHYYHGRDYFNVRYDDIVSVFQLGITFSFNKKLPLKFNSLEGGRQINNNPKSTE